MCGRLLSTAALIFSLAFLIGCKEEEPIQPAKVNFKPLEELYIGPYSEAPVGYDPIIFAINHEAISIYPDWQERASIMIDSVNQVFSKTTNRKYFISKYMSYHGTRLKLEIYKSDYYLKFDQKRHTTIFYYSDTTTVDTTEPNENAKYCLNIGAYAGNPIIDNVMYFYSVIANCGQINIFKNLSEYDKATYQYLFLTFVHELGHTNGLGFPDSYLYFMEDYTGVEPILPEYRITDKYPNDPMMGYGNESYFFNEMNSKIINANLDYKWSFFDVNKFAAKRSIVKVTLEDGTPIQNAKVQIYKARFYNIDVCLIDEECPFMDTPLEELFTDENGEIEYNPPCLGCNDVNSAFSAAKIIKVYVNEDSMAKYVTYLDLQEDFILDSSNVHFDHFIF